MLRREIIVISKINEDRMIFIAFKVKMNGFGNSYQILLIASSQISKRK
jgi:hypothetical protein